VDMYVSAYKKICLSPTFTSLSLTLSYGRFAAAFYAAFTKFSFSK